MRYDIDEDETILNLLNQLEKGQSRTYWIKDEKLIMKRL